MAVEIIETAHHPLQVLLPLLTVSKYLHLKCCFIFLFKSNIQCKNIYSYLDRWIEEYFCPANSIMQKYWIMRAMSDAGVGKPLFNPLILCFYSGSLYMFFCCQFVLKKKLVFVCKIYFFWIIILVVLIFTVGSTWASPAPFEICRVDSAFCS